MLEKLPSLRKGRGVRKGPCQKFATEDAWWYELPCLVYVSLRVELNIGQARTRQGRPGGLWIGAYICSPCNQIPAWDEHDRLRNNVPKQPRLCISRFSRDRSWSRIQFQRYRRWRRT